MHDHKQVWVPYHIVMSAVMVMFRFALSRSVIRYTSVCRVRGFGGDRRYVYYELHALCPDSRAAGRTYEVAWTMRRDRGVGFRHTTQYHASSFVYELVSKFWAGVAQSLCVVFQLLSDDLSTTAAIWSRVKSADCVTAFADLQLTKEDDNEDFNHLKG
jgi:hypothetical protein